MPLPPPLLLPSDDSDGGEVDGVIPRRNKRQRLYSYPCFLRNASLCTVGLLVVLLGLFYNQYLLRRKFNELNETLSELILLPSRLKVVEEDIHRLRMEFDLSRDTQEYSNGSTSIITYVYDTLKRIEADLMDTKATVQRTHNAMEDVTRRVSTMEGRCLAVCQLEDRRAEVSRSQMEVRDKQRRRQAEKKQTHEIIFKREGQ